MDDSPKKIFDIELEATNGAYLKGKYHSNWVEESFTFKTKVGKQVVGSQSNNYIGNNFTKQKFFWLLFILAIIFLLFLTKIFYLQIISGSNYFSAAESNRQRVIPIPSQRGLIYDRNGVLLTQNIPSFSLAIVPQDLPKNVQKREDIVKKISELTDQDENNVRNILDEYKDYSYESIVIKENLSYETALKIQLQTPDLLGVEIQEGSKRLYLHDLNSSSTINTYVSSTITTPLSISHILGYEGKLNKTDLDLLHPFGYLPSDYFGVTGVEKTYEKYLRGIYGKKRIEVDASGREQTVLAEEVPQPGSNLKLTIDLKMQNELERIVRSYLIKNNKNRASAIVLNPNNGEILAMVSWPTFDNNDFSGGIGQEKYNKYLSDTNKPLFNRAIAGTYPSGSSIKPAIAAAALQNGTITDKTSFLSTGGLKVGQWFFTDWQAGGHGLTDVRKALAWSVNTFFYYVGGGYGNFTGMGVEEMMSWLRKFGFGNKLGIDLPNEQAGFLPSKKWKEDTLHEKWYVGDTYNLSIGQGNLLVTPLQIASLTATVANGGKIYMPHVVGSIVNPITKEEKDYEIKILGSNFISQTNIQTVRLGMKDCVTYGSCRRLSNLPFSSAGKTGTAQWNEAKANHAWFTSFAPFENPQVVVTVMVEEGGEGSSISAPIADDFYKWWWRYQNTNL